MRQGCARSSQLDVAKIHAGLLECFTATLTGKPGFDMEAATQLQSRVASELERSKFILFAQALATQRLEAAYRDAHDFATKKALEVALRKVQKENQPACVEKFKGLLGIHEADEETPPAKIDPAPTVPVGPVKRPRDEAACKVRASSLFIERPKRQRLD